MGALPQTFAVGHTFATNLRRENRGAFFASVSVKNLSIVLLAARLSDNLGKPFWQKIALGDQMFYAVSSHGAVSLAPAVGTSGSAGMREGTRREAPAMRHDLQLDLSAIPVLCGPGVPPRRQGTRC